MNDMNDLILIIHAMNSEQFCSLSVNRIINPLFILSGGSCVKPYIDTLHLM